MRSLDASVTDLRRFVRLRVTAPVTVQIEHLHDMPAKLRDLGLGGFAIESRSPFWAGSHHHFHFSLPSGEVVSLTATAVHCYAQLVGHEQQFITGWRFLPGNRDADIERLVEGVTEIVPKEHV